MLRILGSHKRLCDGFSRRDFLQAGGLGLLGLGAQAALSPVASAAADVPRPASFGRAKRCILLYLYGAASQLETFDPKPDAPVQVRGELGTIATSVPGVQIGELLPQVSRIIDRATIVRSMTHPYPLHASAFTLTSIPTIDVPLQMSPRDPRHWPFIGSVVDYLADQRGDSPGPIARNIGLALAAQFAARLCRRRQCRTVRRLAGPRRTIRCGPISKARARAPRPTRSAIRRSLPGSLRSAGAGLPLRPGGRCPSARRHDARSAQSPPLAVGAVRRRPAERWNPAPRRARSTISASRPFPI